MSTTYVASSSEGSDMDVSDDEVQIYDPTQEQTASNQMDPNQEDPNQMDDDTDSVSSFYTAPTSPESSNFRELESECSRLTQRVDEIDRHSELMEKDLKEMGSRQEKLNILLLELQVRSSIGRNAKHNRTAATGVSVSTNTVETSATHTFPVTNGPFITSVHAYGNSAQPNASSSMSPVPSAIIKSLNKAEENKQQNSRRNKGKQPEVKEKPIDNAALEKSLTVLMSKNTINSFSTEERKHAVAEIVRDMILEFEKDDESDKQRISKLRAQSNISDIHSIVQSTDQLSIQPHVKPNIKPNVRPNAKPNAKSNAKPNPKSNAQPSAQSSAQYDIQPNTKHNPHHNIQTSIQSYLQPQPSTAPYNVEHIKQSHTQPAKANAPQEKHVDALANEQHFNQVQKTNTPFKRANVPAYTPPSVKKRKLPGLEDLSEKTAQTETSDQVMQEQQQTNAHFRPFRSITSTLGLGSAQIGEPSRPDTAPLCIFESSGGQCNDGNCKASHWRDFIK